MAGVASATLTGWAIPIFGKPDPVFAGFGIDPDHTYVTSSCGLKWGCWGRDTGGRSLQSGIGSSAIADCLSQPNSEAGINYGFTGVCHQTSNRILRPARITVAGCVGYNVSVALFREFGLGPWHELSICDPQDPLAMVVATASPYGNLVSSRMSRFIPEQDATVRELAALIEGALEEPIDRQSFEQMAEVQIELRVKQDNLIHSFEAHDIAPSEYLNKLNTAFREAMEQHKAILGANRFHCVFGDVGEYPERVVDPQKFYTGVEAQRRR